MQEKKQNHHVTGPAAALVQDLQKMTRCAPYSARRYERCSSSFSSVNLSQRLNTEQRGDSTDEQATPRARTSASAYAA